MRRVALRPRPPTDHSSEPGYRAWHTPSYGRCEVCGAPGPLERHHVITERHVRREGGDPWDLANALCLGRHCRCHSEHTSAARRLPISAITQEHLAFMLELLGEDRAQAYLVRYYRIG